MFNLFQKKRKKRRRTSRVPLVNLQDDRSVVSEQFRTIRTNLTFQGGPQEARSIVITSANPSEGKSLVAANLAIAYASLNKNVLLVDADLRRPSLSHTFNLSHRVGLSNFIQEDGTPLSDCLWDTQVDNLAIMPSGTFSGKPAELLASDKMSALIGTLEKFYDYVIYDLPPLLTVADGQIIASQADGTIVVVRSGKTAKRAYKKTCDVLEMSQANILGVIYNEAEPGDSKYYQYGY